MKLLFIISLIIYLINYINADTYILIADKCIGKSNCYYNDILNANAKPTDDLVFLTTDPTAIPTVNVPSKDLSFNSLNISNVILNVVTQGKLSVNKSIYVGPKGSLILNSPQKSFASDLIIDGGFSITSSSGGLNITNNLNASSTSKIELTGSNLRVGGGLNLMKNGADVVFGGTSTIFFVKYANFQSNIQVIGNTTLMFDTGVYNFFGISASSSDAKIVVSPNANIKFGPSSNTSTIDCQWSLYSGSNLFFSGSNIKISNIAQLSNTTMYLTSNSIVSINNRTLSLALNYLSLDQSSQITFDNSLFKVDAISSSSDSIINIKNQNVKFGNNTIIMGQLNLINTQLSLASGVNLGVGSGLTVDAQSNITIPIDSGLSVSSSSNIISNQFNIDGMLNIRDGSIQFNKGLINSQGSIISCNNSTIEINGDTVELSGKLLIEGDSSQLNINSINNKFNGLLSISSTKAPVNINSNSIVTISSNCNFNSPVYCHGNSIVNIIMGSNIQFNGGLSTELNSILSLQSSEITLDSISAILGEIQLNNASITSLGSTTIKNSITSDRVNLNNNLNINGGSCLIDSKNSIDISGLLNVLNDSALIINDAIVSIGDGVINNGGKIQTNSLINTTKSFSQTSKNSQLVLLDGSNIISTLVDLQSGKVSGNGIISSNKCQCGGIINSKEITIKGNLELLNTTTVQIEIYNNNNYSRIYVSGNVNLNSGAIIDVILNNGSNINDPTFSIIYCTSPNSVINGSLSISKDDTKLFKSEKSKSGYLYNLLFQSTNSNSGNSMTTTTTTSTTSTTTSDATSTTTTTTTTSTTASTTTGKNVEQNSSFKLVSSLSLIILSFILSLLF
ncbi:hypothetical protein ACTA71_006512 [Dictyostelium dimigraforme]